MTHLTEQQKYKITLRYLSGDGTHASLAAEYKTSRQQIADAVRAYAEMPDAVRAREGLWLSMQLAMLAHSRERRHTPCVAARLPGKGGTSIY